jgi:beta-galactosidase
VISHHKGNLAVKHAIGLTTTVAMLWAAVLCGRVFAEGELTLQELEVDHALTFDFPTPHTDWARPYAGGKLRVLFFSDGLGTAPRECVELMERFDIQGKAVFRAEIVDANRSHWHGGDVGVRRMVALLREKWDAFVFFGIPPAALPLEAQYRLLRAVADGAGLVLLGTDDARVLKPKNLLKELPPLLAAGPAGEPFRVGKGRGVRFSARPWIPYQEGWAVEDDYWQERLGRAVVWAAGREPGLRIEAVPSKLEYDRADRSVRLALRLSGRPVKEKLTLDLRIRRAADRPIRWPSQAVSAGASLELAIPRLPAGEYHADVRVLSPAGVESWATAAWRVTAARRVAAIRLVKDWGEVGGRIAGRVVLAGPEGKHQAVRVRLLDHRRRELAVGDLGPSGGEAAFDFPIQPWMPMLVTVEAQLLDDGGEAARAWQYFHVSRRNRGKFNFLVWDFPVGTLAPYAEESLARHGTTIQLQATADPPPYIAAFDVAYVPYTTRILSSAKTAEGRMQPFCWNDEAAVNRTVTELAQRYRPSRQHGVFAYSLGDENETLGCCLSPHCARAYRKYLKETYGSLAALNRSWDTAFKSWEEVGLSATGDNEENYALEHGRPSRWFDRQAFKSYNYVNYCSKYARAYQSIDPQAKTGFEGAGGFASGDDLDLIVRRLTFWSPYPSTADEVIRSIGPRELPRANWIGYTKDATTLLEKYWRIVTRGGDAVWWWRWDCIGAFHGWLAPDLRPYPAVKEILDDTQVLRDGLGDLLLASEMQDDGIAMLYSYPSTFACRLSAGDGYGDYESSHLRLHEALRELGLQFRYVTDRMLRLGEFQPRRYKLLILSRAEAIGDREARVIREFAEQGGTVLADVRPGLYDDHCQPRAAGVLDDLFGIAHAGKAGGKTAGLATTAKAFAPLRLEKVQVDGGVRIAGPHAAGLAAAGGVPAVIVNPVGKGQAVLLNFAAAGFPRLGAAETPEAAAEFVRALLSQAGLSAALRVTDSSGKRVRNLETIRWQDGGYQIVALFRANGVEQPATLDLGRPGPQFVYDLRSRKALGRVSGVPVCIRPARPALVVLSTRPAPAPVLTLERSGARRGEVVRATISVPQTEGLHALRIRGRLGNRPLAWLDQNILAGREAKTFPIPLARNDPAGDYQILAIDLFTNQPCPAVLTVR